MEKTNSLEEAQALLQQVYVLGTNGNDSNSNNLNAERLINSLNSRIRDFEYDPELVQTFDVWYQRFGDTFEKDAELLDDGAKVRLLNAKLSNKVFKRYCDLLFPKIIVKK